MHPDSRNETMEAAPQARPVSANAMEPPGILASLATRARKTPPGKLEFAAVAGTVALASALVFRVSWWEVALPFVTAGSFGAWGVVAQYREAKSDLLDSRALLALSAAQLTFTATGIVAAIAAGYAIVGGLMGTFTS
ncbi:MAG: hypothetical protein M3Q09_11815 [Gemmatimonadota bacterium]|nr:hypothetical protein [Gemmatimonadota bacterium]